MKRWQLLSLCLCAALLPHSALLAQRRPATSSGVQVRVPETAHVHVTVPAGLQHWLDEDDRMIPWLNKAIYAIDACYADTQQSNPQASGTIAVAITMHQNARPSGSVVTLPAPLKRVVACATRQLWSARMPLFTGSEGQRFTLQVHFTP